MTWKPAAQSAECMAHVKNITNRLVDGDPLHPSDGDIITQLASLDVGLPCPKGWRVLTGNAHFSQIARTVLRYEIEEG